MGVEGQNTDRTFLRQKLQKSFSIIWQLITQPSCPIICVGAKDTLKLVVCHKHFFVQ